jgi:hypothetical protein
MSWRVAAWPGAVRQGMAGQGMASGGGGIFAAVPSTWRRAEMQKTDVKRAWRLVDASGRLRLDGYPIEIRLVVVKAMGLWG